MKNISVCIPTYYGSHSLVESVSSIRTSKNGADVTIIVALDGKPLEATIKKALQDLKVQLIENTDNKGQMARIKQMIELVKTPITVLTQDDILFEDTTLTMIAESFAKHQTITMIGALELPTPAKLFIEKVVATGISVARYIGKNWNGGDNYLMASGRCLAFRTDFLRTLELPEKIINSDAYLYFATKQKGGVFSACTKAVVRNPAPQTVAEHLKQAQRFSISQKENEYYLNTSLQTEYALPLLLEIRALLRSLLLQPFYTVLYLLLETYSHWYNAQQKFTVTGTWQTDVSTKRAKKAHA